MGSLNGRAANRWISSGPEVTVQHAVSISTVRRGTKLIRVPNICKLASREKGVHNA